MTKHKKKPEKIPTLEELYELSDCDDLLLLRLEIGTKFRVGPHIVEVSRDNDGEECVGCIADEGYVCDISAGCDDRVRCEYMPYCLGLIFKEILQ